MSFIYLPFATTNKCKFLFSRECSVEGRHDIAQNMGCAINYCVEGDSQERLIRHYYCPYDRLLLRKKLPPQNTPPAWTALQNADGMEGIDNSLTTARFGGDSRLLHVRRMLASNSPVILMASEHTDDSAESSQWQQAKLQTLATRTMTLSVGMSICLLLKCMVLVIW